jgi:hypothetical protein
MESQPSAHTPCNSIVGFGATGLLRQGGAIPLMCGNRVAHLLLEIMMRNAVKKPRAPELARNRSWKAKRDKSIERFVAAWEKYGGPKKDDPEDVNAALDAVTVAHFAATLKWNGESPVGCEQWEDKEDRAMERLAIAWDKYDRAKKNPEAEKALEMALDALAMAHTAATFEWASGPLTW